MQEKNIVENKIYLAQSLNSYIIEEKKMVTIIRVLLTGVYKIMIKDSINRIVVLKI